MIVQPLDGGRIAMNRLLPLILIHLTLGGGMLLADPAREAKKPPADDLDALLNAAKPATRPAGTPASRPAAPFEEKKNPESRKGTITLSNGEKIPAQLSTTREKPVRIWVESAKEYKDVPFNLIRTMEATLLWERDEKEWAFKESGSDIKVYSGKTYPAREMVYKVELVNGQSITGGIVAPIYASGGEETLTFVLNKRQKGDVGRTLKELIYVKRVDLQD